MGLPTSPSRQRRNRALPGPGLLQPHFAHSSPLPHPSFSPSPLVSMGTKRQPPGLRRRQFPRQLATAGTGWAEVCRISERGLGVEEWGSCVFLLKMPALPAACPPHGLALIERVVATTTSMPSTENGLNCLSGRRMNSCLRR